MIEKYRYISTQNKLINPEKYDITEEEQHKLEIIARKDTIYNENTKNSLLKTRNNLLVSIYFNLILMRNELRFLGNLSLLSLLILIMVSTYIVVAPSVLLTSIFTFSFTFTTFLFTLLGGKSTYKNLALDRLSLHQQK